MRHALDDALSGVDMARLTEAIDGHVADSRLHARAVVVVRKGQVIYEKYGNGGNASTPMLGW